MTDESQSQLKKLLAATLSEEARRIIWGLLDGTIELTIPQALEIIRVHVYHGPTKEYLTSLALRFQNVPSFRMTDYHGGRESVVTVPLDINKSRVFRQELIRHILQQSSAVWTDIFRDSIAFSAAMAVNRRSEPRRRRKTTLEDLIS